MRKTSWVLGLLAILAGSLLMTACPRHYHRHPSHPHRVPHSPRPPLPFDSLSQAEYRADMHRLSLKESGRPCSSAASPCFPA